jgi:hypothetical protein
MKLRKQVQPLRGTAHGLTQLGKGVLAGVGAVNVQVVTRLVECSVVHRRPRHRVLRGSAAALPVEAVLRARGEEAQRPLLRLEVAGKVGMLAAVLANLVGQVAAVVRQVAQLLHFDADLTGKIQV